MLIPTEATRVSVTRWLGRLVVQYLAIDRKKLPYIEFSSR